MINNYKHWLELIIAGDNQFNNKELFPQNMPFSEKVIV